jgi:hypothetical protein
LPRSLGSELPPPLAELLDGSDLAGRAGLTFLLLTTAPDGWPHVAMLSAGEVLAQTPRQVRLALWPGSRTSENLGRSGRALLMAVVAPATYYVRVDCRSAGDVRAGSRPLAAFQCEVAEVQEDVVAYAQVLHGIGFELPDPGQTIASWEAAIAALRDLEERDPKR